jgi:hypothetical protein
MEEVPAAADEAPEETEDVPVETDEAPEETEERETPDPLLADEDVPPTEEWEEVSDEVEDVAGEDDVRNSMSMVATSTPAAMRLSQVIFMSSP